MSPTADFYYYYSERHCASLVQPERLMVYTVYEYACGRVSVASVAVPVSSPCDVLDIASAIHARVAGWHSSIVGWWVDSRGMHGDQKVRRHPPTNRTIALQSCEPLIALYWSCMSYTSHCTPPSDLIILLHNYKMYCFLP